MRTVLAVALLLALAPAARAEERTLATKQDHVNVHAYRGVAIFSLWNGSAYTLVASTNGGAPQPLNVPPQRFAFDADIGRRAGTPMVVLHRSCKPSCELELLALDGTPPQPTGIKVPSGEVHPTLWDGTIAWFDHGRVRTKTRTLTRVSKGTNVLALELFGHELALNVVAPSRDAGVCGRREVRLLHLGAKRGRVLGTQICGLNGQVFWGPTFDAGWLYFTRSCNTNCGTTRYGTYRYRNGHYEIAGDNHPLQDWAWGGHGSVYQLRGTDGAGCSDPDVECTLVWTDGLQFKPVGGPIHR